MIKTHYRVFNTGVFNFEKARIVLPSRFNFKFLQDKLVGYHDIQVLDMLKFGFPLSHDGTTGSHVIPKNHSGATLFPDHIRELLRKEVSYNSVLGPFKDSPFGDKSCYSPLNSVPKRESLDRRLILDLSLPAGNAINEGISKDVYLGECEKLSLPSIDKLVERIQFLGRGCKVFKVDLKRAYRQIYLDPFDFFKVGYVFEQMVFFDCTLSMGSRSSAKCCQRVSSAIVFMQSKDGFFLVNYLDDLGGAEPEEIAMTAFNNLRSLLKNAGLQEAAEKTVLPCTIMVFLGIEVNTITMTLKIPLGKWEEIQKLLNEWKNKHKVNLKEVQQLAGLLNFACKCVKSGRVYLSRILNFLRILPKFGKRVIPSPVREDISWWQEFAPKFNGVSLITDKWWSKPDEVVSTDSCLDGGGTYFEGNFCHWKYPSAVLRQNWNINQLECLMLVMACKLWAPRLRRKKLVILCDNQISVLAVNSSSSRDKVIQACLRELHSLMGIHSFELHTVFLPGVDNKISDSLSRWHKSDYFKSQFEKCTAGIATKEFHIHPWMWQFLDKVMLPEV